MTKEEVEMLIRQKAAEVLGENCLGDNVKFEIASIGEVLRACFDYASHLYDGIPSPVDYQSLAFKIFDAYIGIGRKQQDVVFMVKPTGSEFPSGKIPTI